MRTNKCIIMIDSYEQGIIVNALNELRNKLIEQERSPDSVDDIMLKIIDAPVKKVRCKDYEAGR